MNEQLKAAIEMAKKAHWSLDKAIVDRAIEKARHLHAMKSIDDQITLQSGKISMALELAGEAE